MHNFIDKMRPLLIQELSLKIILEFLSVKAIFTSGTSETSLGFGEPSADERGEEGASWIH